MGAWGYGSRQDDFVCVVIGVFEDLLTDGKGVADTTESVKSRFGAVTTDSDDCPPGTIVTVATIRAGDTIDGLGLTSTF